jgi:hypothetical protein
LLAFFHVTRILIRGMILIAEFTHVALRNSYSSVTHCSGLSRLVVTSEINPGRIPPSLRVTRFLYLFRVANEIDFKWNNEPSFEVTGKPLPRCLRARTVDRSCQKHRNVLLWYERSLTNVLFPSRASREAHRSFWLGVAALNMRNNSFHLCKRHPRRDETYVGFIGRWWFATVYYTGLSILRTV